MTLTEFQVYRLKVGLLAHRFGETTNCLESRYGLVHAGSDVWLDQVKDGWASCHLFGKEHSGLYVTFPVDIAESQVEEVLDKDGKPEMVEHTDRTTT